MGEGGNPSTSCAWGCTPPRGWVPFPKKIPRRHPLIDSVGRIDDPCARPAYLSPKFDPTPKFKPPREGYPNDMCNISDYKNQEGDEGALATINLANGTVDGVTLRVKPIAASETIMAEPPTIEDCCKDSRDLRLLQEEVDKLDAERCEKPEDAKTDEQQQEEKVLPDWPCHGIIRPPRPSWPKPSPTDRCKPSLPRESLQEYKPLTGREFVEGKRTCDLYPIHKDLPSRFNNAEWFKGYGCERQSHPFYQTTQMDYFRFPPTAHTMTQAFYPLNCKFTDHLAKTGMPRNRSLNLMSDKSPVL